jgi:hypothetical protein
MAGLHSTLDISSCSTPLFGHKKTRQQKNEGRCRRYCCPKTEEFLYIAAC